MIEFMTDVLLVTAIGCLVFVLIVLSVSIAYGLYKILKDED